MEEFKKVLFPVDLSEVSPKIVPWVLMMGRTFHAEIHLLFVVRKLDHFSSIYVPYPSIENFEEELVRGGETKMEEFSDLYFKSYHGYKSHVVLGDPSEEILKYVEAEKIDLIIMGTHGRKGLERIIFGSVAERVIKMSPVPVMSVNPFRAMVS